MQSKIIEPKGDIHTYPVMLTSIDKEIVILFNANETGMVIYSKPGSTKCALGTYSCLWNMRDYPIVVGSVLLLSEE